MSAQERVEAVNAQQKPTVTPRQKLEFRSQVIGEVLWVAITCTIAAMFWQAPGMVGPLLAALWAWLSLMIGIYALNSRRPMVDQPTEPAGGAYAGDPLAGTADR